MSAPRRHPAILQPPTRKLLSNPDEASRYHEAIWKRSGGYTANMPDLKGLEASVSELNTLVGIKTTDNSTVQKQLDLKADSADIGTIASQDADSVAITGGTISGVTISGSSITIPVGTSTSNIQLGGTLNVNTTAASNTGGAETNLISYSLPANSLTANGDCYEVLAWGTVAANANNKRIRLKYGATTIYDTGAVAANSGSWCLKSTIIRTGAATQTVVSVMISSNNLIAESSEVSTPTETLSGAVTLVCTGLGVATNDITQSSLIVKWFKA